MWDEVFWIEANVFDPIKQQLDQRVFRGEEPRHIIVNFIRRKINSTLYDSFVDDPARYFDLYLTGSLTTFQYSDNSDCDISVFPNYEALAGVVGEDDYEEIRKTIIAILTTDLDGTHLPGTTHPLQLFTQPYGLTPADIFRRGERSAWSFQSNSWLVQPERERVHDVMAEMPNLFEKAQAVAEKMTILLDKDDADGARELYKQIHKKRTQDEKAGLGDFSEGNIEYKWLLHAGLFDRLNDEAGMHLAKVSKSPLLENPISYRFVPLTDEELRNAASSSETFANTVKHLRDYANKKGASGTVNATNLAALYNRYHGSCAYCGEEGANSWDHVVPLSKGGQNTVDNLLPCHEGCNSDLGIWDSGLIGDTSNTINVSPAWRLYPAEAKKEEKEKLKIIYDFDRDEILLGTTAGKTPRDGLIIGDYDGKNVRLLGVAKQWINANYFKKLWLNSFPSRPIEKIFFDKTEIPTRPSKQLTYTQKLPHLVSGQKTADKWRDGKEWKDFIKNRGIIVDFRIGNKDDDPVEGKIIDFDSHSVTIEIANGDHRTFDSELLKDIKFKVRDDKHYVSSLKFLFAEGKLSYGFDPVNLLIKRGHFPKEFVLGEYEDELNIIQAYGNSPVDTDLIFLLKKDLDPHFAEDEKRTVEDTEPAENFGFLTPPHEGLYPCAWENEKMRPEAKRMLKAHVLNEIESGQLAHAEQWIYFTVYGSGASYNWDEDGDFDIQMWINVEKYNDHHPDTPKESDELVADIRRIVQQVNFPSFDDLGLDTKDCAGDMLIQYYPKAGTGAPEENLAQKPYACYDMETDEWIVKPKPITPEFYGEHFAALQDKAIDIAEQTDALIGSFHRNVLNWQFFTKIHSDTDNKLFQSIAEKSQRDATEEQQGIAVLFHGIFGGRQEAYSPEGEGIEDERDELQKLLEVWGVFQQLKHWSRAPLPWDKTEMPSRPVDELSKETAWNERTAVKVDPMYWKTHGLPGSGCFGYINGHLLMGDSHHQAIMGSLINNGWTWEQLMAAPQAWGWFSVSNSKNRIRVTFTSDSGFQVQDEPKRALGAFAQLYHLPAFNPEDEDTYGVEPAQYGMGLGGEKPYEGYEESYLKGVVPKPDSTHEDWVNSLDT